MTTNLGIPSWGKIFDDPMVAAAMLDRLLHRSVVLNITGESYRMRAHRARAAKLRTGEVATTPETANLSTTGPLSPQPNGEFQRSTPGNSKIAGTSLERSFPPLLPAEKAPVEEAVKRRWFR